MENEKVDTEIWGMTRNERRCRVEQKIIENKASNCVSGIDWIIYMDVEVTKNNNKNWEEENE